MGSIRPANSRALLLLNYGEGSACGAALGVNLRLHRVVEQRTLMVSRGANLICRQSQAPSQIRAGKFRGPQVGLLHVRVFEINAFEVRTAQVRFFEIGANEIGKR